MWTPVSQLLGQGIHPISHTIKQQIYNMIVSSYKFYTHTSHTHSHHLTVQSTCSVIRNKRGNRFGKDKRKLLFHNALALILALASDMGYNWLILCPRTWDKVFRVMVYNIFILKTLIIMIHISLSIMNIKINY